MLKQGFDVFLSYHRDDRRSVEFLAEKLRHAGISPWLDKWNLVPGTAFQPEIEDALAHCLSCAVFIGRSGIGPWQNEEMRFAIQRRVDSNKSFRVIPVLLPGARTLKRGELPQFLTASTWVEFRRTIRDREAYRRLVCGITGKEPGPGLVRANARTQWVIVLSGTVDDADRARAETIVEHLRELCEDGSLTMKKYER